MSVAPARTGARRALGAATALLRREILRFVRDRHRVFGALVQPILFWVLFAAGLGASFRPGAAPAMPGYGEYFFPGTVVLILLFTAIFSTISVIEDRREGFLQAVLAAPIPRSSLVLGKVAGGGTLAFAQGGLVLLLAPIAGIPLPLAARLAALPILAILALALTAFSFCIAWRMESTQGFHAVMTVLLMPLWLLSGAFFPAQGAPGWLRLLMTIDPLTYGMAAFRHVLYPAGSPALAGLPAPGLSVAVTLLFAFASFAGAAWMARRGHGPGAP